jgi:hypothetical protein
MLSREDIGFFHRVKRGQLCYLPSPVSYAHGSGGADGHPLSAATVPTSGLKNGLRCVTRCLLGTIGDAYIARHTGRLSTVWNAITKPTTEYSMNCWRISRRYAAIATKLCRGTGGVKWFAVLHSLRAERPTCNTWN